MHAITICGRTIWTHVCWSHFLSFLLALPHDLTPHHRLHACSTAPCCSSYWLPFKVTKGDVPPTHHQGHKGDVPPTHHQGHKGDVPPTHCQGHKGGRPTHALPRSQRGTFHPRTAKVTKGTFHPRTAKVTKGDVPPTHRTIHFSPSYYKNQRMSWRRHSGLISHTIKQPEEYLKETPHN